MTQQLTVYTFYVKETNTSHYNVKKISLAEIRNKIYINNETIILKIRNTNFSDLFKNNKQLHKITKEFFDNKMVCSMIEKGSLSSYISLYCDDEGTIEITLIDINKFKIDNKDINTRIYNPNNTLFEGKDCFICMMEINDSDANLSDYVVQSNCCYNGAMSCHLACFSKLNNNDKCSGCRGILYVDYNNLL